MNPFIRLLYAVLIAVAVVTFVGMGIATFYPAPEAPTYGYSVVGKEGPSAVEQRAFDDANKRYQTDSKTYNRTVSLVGSLLAVAIVTGGLYLRRRSDVIGEGIAFGGVATSVYGIVTAVSADDRVMRFVAVSIFLASSIVVVYVQVSDRAQTGTSKKPVASR